MAVDWLTPVIGTLFEDVLTFLRERDENVAKMNFDADSNVPTGYIRSNTVSDDQLERFNGATYDLLGFHSTIDAHIADTNIHAIIEPGTLTMYAGASAPAGWAFARGQALSRTTVGNGLELFNNIGIAYGSGDGSTTFNVPDFRRRFPIGKADSGSVSNLGDNGGDFDHVHGLPDHTHTVPDHQHGLANHVHPMPGHKHVIGPHKHKTRAHFHSVNSAPLNPLSISGGAHSHGVSTQENAQPGSSRRTINQSGGAAINRATEDETHSHPNSEFSGHVGLGEPTGTSGDIDFDTLNSIDFESGYNGVVNTDAPTSSLSDFISGGSQPTGLAGSAAPSDAANPPYLSVNFIIKL
ncbi:MAG: hypothetical protein DRH08_13575 [Deltaproteobacteria bacterium]|nr:MAG: hypothetical protein DRH08_13575 [Deltaproteobacteria bacterium]